MKLILINGPAGVGKTTLSYKLNEVMPMSYVLDLDKQRQFIGQYEKYSEESRWLSFDIALAIAEVCLRNKRDFIFGKCIFQVNKKDYSDKIIDKFVKMGKKHHAEIYELFLMAEKKTTLKRIKQRGYAQKVKNTKEKISEHYSLAEKTLLNRPKAIMINTDHLSQNETFKKVCEIIKI